MASTAYMNPSRRERPSGLVGERQDDGEPGSVLAWWLSILVWLLLALGAAAAYLAWTTPLYTASTSVLLDAHGSAAVNPSEPSTARLGQDVSLIESRVRLVSSPAVLARVAESQDLAEDPEFSEPGEPLVLRLRRLLGWEPEGPPMPLEQRVLAALAERLDVKRAEGTSIIDIAVTSRDPAKAARLADAVAAAFVESQTPIRPPPSRDEGEQLEARLRALEETIRADERKLEAFRAEHLGLAASGSASDDRQLIDPNAALLQARTAAKEARAKLDQVERAIRAGRVEALPPELGSAVLGALRNEAAERQRRTERLAKILGPRHPDLVEAQQQLQSTQALVRDELRRVAAGLSRDVEQADAAEAAALRRLEARKREIAGANQARAELLNLERAVQNGRAAYEKLLAEKRPQEVESAPPSPRLLAPALLPLRPDSPDPRWVLSIAAAVGLVLGLATAWLRERRMRRKPAASLAPGHWNEDLASRPAGLIPGPVSALDAEGPEPGPDAHVRGFQPISAAHEAHGPSAGIDTLQDPAAPAVPGSAADRPPSLTRHSSVRRSPEAAEPDAQDATAQVGLAPDMPDDEPAAASGPIADEGDPVTDRPASAPHDGYVRRFHLGQSVRPAK